MSKIIPPNKKNKKSNNIEIYLCDGSGKTSTQYEDDNFILSKQNTWPNFCKFTEENIPINFYENEYITFVSCGLQFLIIVTNFSKCYLFGHFYYKKHGIALKKEATLLPFKLHDNDQIVNQLNCKITNIDCGEQFVVLKDEFHRFWYCGLESFGSGSTELKEFIELESGDLINHDKITHVIAGGRHVIVCLNNQLLYGIGNNYSRQLGVDFSEVTNEFKKSNWNIDEKYFIKTIAACECGKLFRTNEMTNDPIVEVKIKCKEIYSVGTYFRYAIVSCDNGLFEMHEDTLELSDFELSLKESQVQNSKLFAGCGNFEYFGSYTENEFTIKRTKTNEQIEIKTDYSIVEARSSDEMILVFCKKENR